MNLLLLARLHVTIVILKLLVEKKKIYQPEIYFIIDVFYIVHTPFNFTKQFPIS